MCVRHWTIIWEMVRVVDGAHANVDYPIRVTDIENNASFEEAPNATRQSINEVSEVFTKAFITQLKCGLFCQSYVDRWVHLPGPKRYC